MTVDLRLGDCLTILPTIPDASIDLIVTDPPFHVTLTAMSKKTPSFDTLKENDWTASFEWLVECARLLSDGGALYVFTADQDIRCYLEFFLTLGMRVYRRLHWIKTNPLPSYKKCNYRGGVELALFAVKGKTPKYFDHKSQQAVLSYWMMPIVGGAERSEHPTQKPVRLMREWISNSCPLGGTVLDPFAGSGTTGVACVLENRNFIGCELNENYFTIAKKRIEQAQAQLTLALEGICQ